MIDEDLYQQAADELNSDKRRPHIWARACALASDDHDEARFLYTNLRVEELLAERENAKDAPSHPIADEHDATLALAPVADYADGDKDLQSGEDEVAEALKDMGLKNISADTPASFSAPGGEHNPESTEDFLQLDPTTDSSPSDKQVIEDPDSDLMSDYVPEGDFKPDADLDSTLTLSPDALPDEGLIGEAYQEELENFKAEHGDTAAFIIADQFDGSTEYDQAPSDVNLDSTTDLYSNALDIATSIDDVQSGVSLDEDSTTEFTAALSPDDLTQANLDVLDAHSNELDEMLEDAHYQPPQPEKPDTDMHWLEDSEEANAQDIEDESAIEHEEEAAFLDDTRTEELKRQVDDLDIGDDSSLTSDQTPQNEGELVQDDTLPESEESSSLVPAAAMGVAAAGAATRFGDTPATHHAGQQFEARDVDELDTSALKNDLPKDLTRGRDGKNFWVFRRNAQAQAVKSGVSWSALFFTLPFLLYRQLFGTALIYAFLWIISIGGLIICGLAWLDAGVAVSPIVQAGTIGFALLAFIGLVYLPFRYANIWRSEKLENSGYELVAITKAKNTGLAIARARRHSVLG